MSETVYYGKYKGIVTNVEDPERRGRIKLQIPSVLGDYTSAWCEPCFPYAGDYSGDYYVPSVNETVWVEFEEGKPDKPVWSGGWYKTDSSPLPTDTGVSDYRFIVFKDSVLRMGEKEFAFELRGNTSSKVLFLNEETILGLNYISSKTESELLDMESLVVNKSFILDEFPKNVADNLSSVEQGIVDVANALNNFVTDTYNPAMNGVDDELKTIFDMLSTVVDKLNEVDNNLRDLQEQMNNSSGGVIERLNAIDRRLDSHRDAYNYSIDQIASAWNTEAMGSDFSYYTMY